MKHSLSHFLLSGICLVCASCGRHEAPSTFTANTEVYTPSAASGFTITADSLTGVTAISVTDPWQSASGVTSTLYIYPEGADIPAGVNAIAGPAKRIIAMSSTYVAMLDAIGEIDRVKGVSGIGFIANPEIARRSDSIVDVGNETDVDFERLVAARPDLVMVYGVSGASAMEPKLKELGIPYIYIGDYLEQNPVGKAEWIVVAGELTGRRDSAETLFEAISNDYNSLRRSITVSDDERPAVLINAPYGDSWFIPSPANYMSQLISDAGARLLQAPGSDPTDKSSHPVETEQIWLMGRQADFWLNPGQYNSVADLTEALPRFADIPAVKNRRVVNNNLRLTAGGGNDFYESGAIRPDIVLRDLISIFHPSDSETELYYHHFLE